MLFFTLGHLKPERCTSNTRVDKWTSTHSRAHAAGDEILEVEVEFSGHKLETSQTRVFVWFSTLIFPFYKIASHE